MVGFSDAKRRARQIRGSDDPHPICGVTKPLTEIGKEYRLYLLDKRGHSPFMEKFAKNEFFRICAYEIETRHL